MNCQGIVITGTSGSGKSTLARLLCENNHFCHVQAVTTRERRTDDGHGTYEYISRDDFDKLVTGDALLVSTTYRDHRYGIRRSSFNEAKEGGRVPVLTLTPESAARLAGFPEKGRQWDLPTFVSFFIDAPDADLDARLSSRNTAADLKKVYEIRAEDRKWQDYFTYIVRNVDRATSAKLMACLWEYSERAGVLSARIISLMLECGMLLQSAKIENVSGASYDLSLGDEYFYGGKVKRLTDSDPILLIEPYDYAIVTSNEVADFPRDICGRFDLTVNLFCQGIILSNGPQMDPGFQGPLFCLLLNTSSSPVLLKRRQHYSTLEFHKLIEPTHLYRGQYRAKTLIDYLPSNAATGAINELKKELERVRQESTRLRDLTWAILAIVLAILSFWAVFIK